MTDHDQICFIIYEDTKCTLTWVDATSSGVPSTKFIASTSTTNQNQRFCIATWEGSETPGTVSTAGCTFAWRGVVQNQTSFKILDGTGFTWTTHTGNTNNNVPLDSFQAGNDQTGTLYLGRCIKNKVTYLGKIGDKFYYANNNKENIDCDTHDILICK